MPPPVPLRNIRVKLHRKRPNRPLRGNNQRPLNRQHNPSVFSRIVKIRDRPPNKISPNIRVPNLPPPIVPLTANRRDHHIPKTLFETAMPQPIISRVLMKQRRKHRISPEIAIKSIGKRRTITLRIARKPLTVFRIGVLRLLNESNKPGTNKLKGIDRRPEEKMELLPGINRSSFTAHDSIEVRNDPQHALLFLSRNLFFSLPTALIWSGCLLPCLL